MAPLPPAAAMPSAGASPGNPPAAAPDPLALPLLPAARARPGAPPQLVAQLDEFYQWPARQPYPYKKLQALFFALLERPPAEHFLSRLVDVFRRSILAADAPPPNDALVCPLFATLSSRCLNIGLRLQEQMVERGIGVPGACYNYLLHAAALAGQVGDALRLFATYEEHGRADCDALLFTSLLDCLRRHPRREVASFVGGRCWTPRWLTYLEPWQAAAVLALNAPREWQQT